MYYLSLPLVFNNIIKYHLTITPTVVAVILVSLAIPVGFRPSKRLGSHEQEITDIGAGNNCGNNRTDLIFILKIRYYFLFICRIIRTVY